MKCEYCGRRILENEATGIRHGSIDIEHEAFIPDRDSAWVVICSFCSSQLHRLIYSNLKPSINPTLYKAFTQHR